MIQVEVVHTFGDKPLTVADVQVLAQWSEALEREIPERELLMRQVEGDGGCEELD